MSAISVVVLCVLMTTVDLAVIPAGAAGSRGAEAASPPADPAPEDPRPPAQPGESRVTGEPSLLAGREPRFDPATSKEVPGKRSADTKVFENADGTSSARIYSKPIHFRAPDGGWREFDNTLVPGRDGRARNVAGPMGIDVAPSGDVADLVALEVGGRRLAYGLAGALPSRARIEGDTAVYESALPGVDLRLSARDASVKEVIVLKSRHTPRRFLFPLRLTPT